MSVDTHPLTVFRNRQTPVWTRAQLARELGVSRAAVTRWEKGDRSVAERLWPVIRQITGVKPSDLVSFQHLEAAE